MATINENELEKMFNDFIDDTSETVKILGLEYQPSAALKEIDPTAYRTHFNDWQDCEIKNGSFSECPKCGEMYADEECDCGFQENPEDEEEAE